METKHTKGEWFVSNDDQIVSMPSQCKIANRVSGCNYEEAKANAKLISSAPELLKACLEAKSMYEAQGINVESRIGGEQYKNLLNAIEKATE